MSVIALVGGQWGDEGKGKITDLLAEKADLVIRFSGGDNAGHTVINPFGEFKLHLIPSGIFHKNTTCILGNGVAINPLVLLDEIDKLQKKNIDISRLIISERAHLIMPYHTLIDRLEEERSGNKAIGTTQKGIGPAFSDKTARLGIRAGDILDKKSFKDRLSSILDLKNAIITKVYNAQPLSFEEIYQQYCDFGQRLAPCIKETGTIIKQALDLKKSILLEGAQGAMLDLDFGTYPYVTSSSPLAANAAIGSGISLNKIKQVLGVYKAYTTRVGGGPMPTEQNNEIGELIRQRAHEYGTTTGRPRRCGWFDAVVAKFSCYLNGCTSVVITRLDILDTLPSIKICTGYKVGSLLLEHFPFSLSALEQCEPVYEELPGWQSPTGEVRKFNKLPVQARKYIARIQELISSPVDIVSVGADREQTITVKSLF